MRHTYKILFLTVLLIAFYSCDKNEDDSFHQKTLTVSVTGTYRVYTINGLLSANDFLTSEQKQEMNSGSLEFIDYVSEEKAILRYPVNSILSGLSINVTYKTTDNTQVFYFNNNPDPYKLTLYKKIMNYNFTYINMNIPGKIMEVLSGKEDLV